MRETLSDLDKEESLDIFDTLLDSITIPEVVKVRQRFERPVIRYLEAELLAKLHGPAVLNLKEKSQGNAIRNKEGVKLVRIKNTLSLGEIEVSENLPEKISSTLLKFPTFATVL